MAAPTTDSAAVAAAPAPVRAPARRRRPRRRGHALRLCLLLVGALGFMFPFWYMVVGSLQAVNNPDLSGAVPKPGNTSLRNYGAINEAISLGRALVNSGIFTGGVVLCTVVFGLLAGYALARLRFRGSGVLFAVVLLVQTIPFQLLTIPLYVLIVRDYGLGDSYLGMIAPFAINSTAVFIFRQFFLQLPNELFEAARIDGVGELNILLRVVLPLCRPVLLTSVLLTFIGPWNEFLWPFLVTKRQSMQPLAVSLADFMSNLEGTVANPTGALLAGSCVLAVPAVLLFLLFQRYFTANDLDSGVKG